MISAFEAVCVVPRVSGERGKDVNVESVDLWDGRHVYVGTSAGQVILYTIDQTPAGTSTSNGGTARVRVGLVSSHVLPRQ